MGDSFYVKINIKREIIEGMSPREKIILSWFAKTMLEMCERIKPKNMDKIYEIIAELLAIIGVDSLM